MNMQVITFVRSGVSAERRGLRSSKSAALSRAAATVACLWAMWIAATASAFAGVEQTVNDLLPKLAAQKVEDRYAPQMELQALALNAARPGAEAERVALCHVLAAKATDASVPQPARVWVVRQIEYIGGEETVPALTQLLADPDAELRECARRALEKNPSPKAGQPLLTALKQGGETTWVIGLVQSLGERRDTEAVDLIARQLTRKETMPAAAAALGKIATPAAVTALWAAYDIGAPGAATALIAAGQQQVASGNRAGAKELFRSLYLAGDRSATTQPQTHPAASIPVRSAALAGWATAEATSARPVIESALRQPQPEIQFAAVIAAGIAFGKAGQVELLAPLLSQLPATAKVYALRLLDAAQEKQLLAAIADPDEAVRVAAVERLGQVGTAAAIPALFTAAGQESPIQKPAAAALASLPDPAADPILQQHAKEGSPSSRVVAINALAARGDRSAAPALLDYAREGNAEVSAAACAALAKVGTDQQLEGLIQLVVQGKTPAAEAAVEAVASRAKDKSAAVAKVLALAQTAQPAQFPPLFNLLALLGGHDALVAVSSAATSTNPEVKDAAVRTLAGWPDFMATRALLVIAMDPHVTKVQNILAIQGVARLVKAADRESATNRVDTAVKAIKAAARDEEKKLLLSALASVPDRSAAQMLKPYLLVPRFQQDAALAAMNLAESLRKSDRATARELAKMVKDAAVSPELTRRADAILKRNS